MTSTEKAAGDRGRRVRVHLPREMVEEFRATTGPRGVNGSTVAYSFITRAVAYAATGMYDLVPARSSSPTTSGDQMPVDIPMGTEESAEIVAILKDAGSSMRAVLGACIPAYTAGGGSHERMAWPRRERRLAA